MKKYNNSTNSKRENLQNTKIYSIIQLNIKKEIPSLKLHLMKSKQTYKKK